MVVVKKDISEKKELTMSRTMTRARDDADKSPASA